MLLMRFHTSVNIMLLSYQYDNVMSRYYCRVLGSSKLCFSYFCPPLFYYIPLVIHKQAWNATKIVMLRLTIQTVTQKTLNFEGFVVIDRKLMSPKMAVYFCERHHCQSRLGQSLLTYTLWGPSLPSMLPPSYLFCLTRSKNPFLEDIAKNWILF